MVEAELVIGTFSALMISGTVSRVQRRGACCSSQPLFKAVPNRKEYTAATGRSDLPLSKNAFQRNTPPSNSVFYRSKPNTSHATVAEMKGNPSFLDHYRDGFPIQRLRMCSECIMSWFLLDMLIRHAAHASTDSMLLSSSGLAMTPAVQGIVSAFLLILFSEIGDKTFFVALLLALQNSKAAVFTGTFGALGIMTLVSVGLGQALHQVDELLPESVARFPVDDVLAIGLLIWFGVLTLQSARDAESIAAAEQEEAQEGVKGLVVGSGGLIFSTFVLVFSAEWGDKSFLATTALAAASSPLGVTIGAIGGHFVATVLAVLGGSFLSNYVSEKTVQYIGGTLFLVFAFTTVIDLVRQVTT